MSDQPSGFTVTDRRKFTIEGDLREGAATAEETPAAPPKPEPAAAGASKLGPKLVESASPVEKEVVNRNLEQLPAEDESVGEDAFSEEALDEEALPPEPTDAESAAKDADYRASSKKLDDMIS